MKSLKILWIVVLSVITFSLCGIMVYGMAGGSIFRNHDRQSYANMQLVLEKELSLDGIDSISILCGMNSNDIYLFESENDAVTIREYSNFEMDEKELSTIKVNENSLEIKGARRNYSSVGFRLFYFNGGSYNRHYTEVYLPASWHGELLLETASGDIISELDIKSEKDVSITSASGDVEFPSVAADNVSVHTSSGDVDFKELSGKTNIESSSGYLTIGTITGDAQLRTSSGDMNIKELTGEVKTESSSGCLTIGTLTGNAQLRTTSGDVNIQYADGDVQVVTTSGDVRVSEGNGGRTISTSSGDVVTGSTEGGFQVNTQSGDVRITMQKGEGRIETASGDVQLRLEELAGTLNVNSSSGYVSITLSDENEFEFMTGTSSGDIVTFFDSDLAFSSRRNHAQGVHGANAQGNRVEIQTTSGDVRISKY